MKEFNGPELIEESTLRHPLEDGWTLWYQKGLGSRKVASAWLDGLKEILSFDTVEDFWCMYNNIKTPTDMPFGSDYCLFKEGIEPKWEARENISGGYWLAQLTKNDNSDKIWLYTVLACIGGDFGFDEYDLITGLYLNVRNSGFKIQLWLKSSDEENVMRIGRRFAEILAESGCTKLTFITCEGAIRGDARPVYSLAGSREHQFHHRAEREERRF